MYILNLFLNKSTASPIVRDVYIFAHKKRKKRCILIRKMFFLFVHKSLSVVSYKIRF